MRPLISLTSFSSAVAALSRHCQLVCSLRSDLSGHFPTSDSTGASHALCSAGWTCPFALCCQAQLQLDALL